MREVTITRSKLWRCVGLSVALTNLGWAEVKFDFKSCCGESFALIDVEAFARKTAAELGKGFHSVMIVPTGTEHAFTIATTSEESVRFCVGIASQFRRKNSHAFLVKTPSGIGFHHWDARREVYQKTVIAGADLLTHRFEAGRLAWIGNTAHGWPRLFLVAHRVLKKEEGAFFLKQVMTMLNLRDAKAWIRTDPYYWPDSCSPYSLPLQWESSEPVSFEHITPRTMFCTTDSHSGKIACYD
jgi:hypothetical protein